jgi:hypothetical protein
MDVQTHSLYLNKMRCIPNARSQTTHQFPSMQRANKSSASPRRRYIVWAVGLLNQSSINCATNATLTGLILQNFLAPIGPNRASGLEAFNKSRASSLTRQTSKVEIIKVASKYILNGQQVSCRTASTDKPSCCNTLLEPNVSIFRIVSWSQTFRIGRVGLLGNWQPTTRIRITFLSG